MTDLEPVAAITDGQRERFKTILREKPHTGYALALRQAGVPGTKGQLRQLIRGDETIQQNIDEAKGELVGKLEKIRMEVAQNPDHPAWERANYSLLTRYDDKWRAVQNRVEITGTDGGPVEVTVEHDYDRIIDKLAQVGLIRRGAEQAPDAETQRLLPAPPD